MMISGTSTSTPGVPRYKGMKMSIHDDDANDQLGNAGKHSKSSARGSESKSGAFGARRNSNSMQSLPKKDNQTHQPRQKKQSVNR